jgi:signal transduction histidine kinase
MEAMLDQLRAVPLENASLVEAIRKAGEALAFRSGAHVDVHIDRLPHSSAFQAGAHQAIFRVVQEALANIGRHARATSVSVTARATGGELIVTVDDDGVGFAGDATSRGMGVQNMRARAAEVGGRLTIDRRPGGGTRVSLSVPYETADALKVSRRRALMLTVVSAAVGAAGLIRLIEDGFDPTNVFLLFFGVGFVHNLVTFRRVTRRLATVAGQGADR